MEKSPSNFDSFILPKIKVGDKTAMLSNAYEKMMIILEFLILDDKFYNITEINSFDLSL